MSDAARLRVMMERAVSVQWKLEGALRLLEELRSEILKCALETPGDYQARVRLDPCGNVVRPGDPDYPDAREV